MFGIRKIDSRRMFVPCFIPCLQTSSDQNTFYEQVEFSPTITPYADFNAEEDGKKLRAAMKGFGTDEKAIIDILTSRSNAQRQEIGVWFKNSLGRDLIDDLKSELGGKFEDVILGLMTPSEQYLCKQLHKAMAGMGTDESTLIEILCSKTNEEIFNLIRVYEDCKDISSTPPYLTH